LTRQSDADEQLLIHLAFKSKVKISAIAIKAPSGSSASASLDSLDHGPSTLKLFVNKPTIGFDQAASDPPTQVLQLSPPHLSGDQIPLRFVKFQNVNSLTVPTPPPAMHSPAQIFIESNQGGSDVTVVTRLALFGETDDVMDMRKELPKPTDDAAPAMPALS
jgi:hypothetical protein